MSFRFARPSLLATCALALATVVTTSLFAQQPKVLAPHRPIAPRLPDNPPKSGPLRSMVGGLWMIDANFKSTIYIKNSVEIAPVTVTPILYVNNGKKITLADITLEPSGTAAVSVNDGLNANGVSPWATLSGYVEIQYKWPWDPLCVTVTSVDTIHSVIFTTGLRPLEPLNPTAKALLAKGPGTQTVEGMWWKQEQQVTGFVALSNTTGQPIQAQLQVSDNAGHAIGEHAVTISAHGTETLNLEELQSAAITAGGLRITYHGGMNDLLPNGGLQDQASGYSASVPFVPSHSLEAHDASETYAELGLMSGAADPMMQFPAGTTFTPYSLLRNISGQPASVTPSLYWMEGGTAHSARLNALTLGPFQTQSLNVPALMAFAGLQNFNGSFNLVFDVKGSVLMASGSVDQKNNYVFEVMPESVKESASKTLGRWSIGNGDDTMVTVWNPADEAQDFVFTLVFSGGRYHLPIHLEARATEMFNVSEVARNQFPNLIPSGVTEGSATISGTHAENEHILVAVDAGVFNVRKATCAYTCRNCNGLVGSILVADGFGVTIGGNFQMSLKDTWNTGVQHDLTNLSTWTSSHTNKATVTSSGSARGLVTGVSAGSLLITGTNDTEPWAGQLCGSPPQNCPPDTGTGGSGGGTVVDVTGVSPSNLVLGTGVPPLAAGTMTISGSGFLSLLTPTVQFDGGVTASNVIVQNDTTITAQYTVDCSVTVGPQNLTVGASYDGGAFTSNPFPVSVVFPPAPTPKILLAGQSISGTQSVVVGQQIALSSSVGLPQCMSLSSQQWSTPPGTAVGGYAASSSSDSVTALPANTNSSYTFYWVSPANSLNMTYQYVMSAGSSGVSSPVATSTFNVAGASVSSMSTPTGSVGIFTLFGSLVLGYGGPVGITFTPTVTTPSGDSGQFNWVQLISNDTQTLTTTGGTVKTCVNVTQPVTASGTGLDSGYPYGTGTSTKDSPSIGLSSSSYTKEARAFSANMYLMWDPALPAGCTPTPVSNCTSIPVPLGSVSWGWSGTASYSAGNWSLTASSNTTPAWTAGNSYPMWSDLVLENGTLSCH